MTSAPTLAAIHDVEARVAQSRRDIGDRTRRVTVAVRANLARPSTMVVVAGAAGLVAFWSARRLGHRARVVGTPPVSGWARAFLLRYITQQLPFIVRQVHAALKQSLPQRDGTPKAAPPRTLP